MCEEYHVRSVMQSQIEPCTSVHATNQEGLGAVTNLLEDEDDDDDY